MLLSISMIKWCNTFIDDGFLLSIDENLCFERTDAW